MFEVNHSTGVLTYDDTTYPATPKVSGGELFIAGYGSFFYTNHSVYVDDDPFLQSARDLHIRATIIFRDSTTLILDDEDCVRFSSALDAGSMFLFGANPVQNFTLVLANDQRQWDVGGAYLGSKSLDGADIKVELGAEDASGTPQYIAMGRFLVDTVDNQCFNTVITLTGVDFMGNKMMTEFVDIASYPPERSSADVVLLACSLAGVTCDINTLQNVLPGNVVKPTFTSKVTCKDVVGWIAQMHQSAVYVDGDGVLKFFYHAGIVTLKVQPNQFMRITTSIPFGEYNYRLEAKTYSGSNTYVVDYEPNLGAPFYSFSIVLSPFVAIDANVETRLTNDIGLVGAYLNMVTSGLMTWRGNGFIPPLRHLTAVKPNGETVIYIVLQNRVTFDGSLVYETGTDLNSLTKNITEGR